MRAVILVVLAGCGSGGDGPCPDDVTVESVVDQACFDCTSLAGFLCGLPDDAPCRSPADAYEACLEGDPSSRCEAENDALVRCVMTDCELFAAHCIEGRPIGPRGEILD